MKFYHIASLFLVMGIFVLIPSDCWADETVTLEDGRVVVLKSDGSYAFVQANKPTNGYRKIGISDLKLDIRKLMGNRIEVIGKISNFGEVHSLSDPTNEFDTNPVFLATEHLPREIRKKLLNCEMGCRTTVRGQVKRHVFMLQPGIFVEHIAFD